MGRTFMRGSRGAWQGRGGSRVSRSSDSSSLPSPLANDDEGDQGGTPENVLESDGRLRHSVRNMARLLQTTLDIWITSPGIQAADAEALNDIVKPTIDALWRF